MALAHVNRMAIDMIRARALRKPDTAGGGMPEFLQDLQIAQHAEPSSLRAWLDLAEAWKIARALRDCRGNRSAAARSLGIGRRTLYAKMEKLDIAPTWVILGDRVDRAE
jgi:DNA-binding NtrC family response regulator